MGGFSQICLLMAVGGQCKSEHNKLQLLTQDSALHKRVVCSSGSILDRQRLILGSYSYMFYSFLPYTLAALYSLFSPERVNPVR